MFTKLNYSGVIALFRKIAEKNKNITYFVNTDLQEIKSIVKSNDPALLFTGPKEKLKSGIQHSNNQSGKQCFFAIVQHYTTKTATVASQESLIDECHDMAIDIVTYLWNEKLNGRLPGFHIDSVNDGEAIVDKDDGFCGWEFSCMIDTPINLAFDASKWNI